MPAEPCEDRLTGPLEAVLWDMDGLLVDSEPVWTVAEAELARSLGGTWDATIKAAVVGTRIDASLPVILQYYGVRPTPEVLAATEVALMARMVELFSASLPVLPGVTPLLLALQAAGIRTALVSSSYRVLVQAVLSHGPSLGWPGFELTLAGDEVGRPKPDPEPYLTAARGLGVSPTRCVVLEDSPTGVASGEAAGCAVVAVPSVPGVELAASARRLVLPSLVGLGVEDLQRLVAVSAGAPAPA